MKKVLATYLMLAMALWLVAPALTLAVSTELTRVDSGTTGNNPIIKAKWEMKGPSFSGTSYTGYTGTGGEGTDDSTADGAQFIAPGTWNATMNYSVCTIVTDPNGVADIDGVYADIYYPESIAFHPESTTYPDVINGGAGNPNDYGQSGCGAFIEENTLMPLDKMDGYSLFCETIQNNNTNLPTFFHSYDYSEICGATGELMKETAKVYCDDKTLTWEDPAGDYKVNVFAIDKSGNFSYDSTPDFNHFEYLPLTAYDIDFTSVNYGNVALNSHKIVSGDLTWDTSDKPSVRNIGNTRLYMNVLQNDMGLGQTSGQWNVKYDARVGNNEADWRNYNPEHNQKLQDILDLSELEEMDFSILVTKFPTIETNYIGTMDLTATQANFRYCDGD